MRFLSALVLLCIAALSVRAADEKIKVLIIDGQNNHAWPVTTPVLKKILEGTDKFAVDVATSPPSLKLPPLPKDATPEQKKEHDAKVAELRKEHKAAFEKFHPDLAKYQVV